MRPASGRTPIATEFSLDAFVEGAEAGRFLEIWNLVFMQFDRQPDGTFAPLPEPSIDTGAGLERIAAVKQGVTNNFHTDVFAPLIARVEQVVGIPYRGRESEALHDAQAGGRTITVEPASFRVLADHARAVAFLLADGVFPSNEGRGYVLRRILRRAVRHAWLLGRTRADARARRGDGDRHDAATCIRSSPRAARTCWRPRAPRRSAFSPRSTRGWRASTSSRRSARRRARRRCAARSAGEDAFRLYDTFGFPIDLTELMARERGYTVDIAGFEAALQAQRKQSQEDRRSRELAVAVDELADLSSWERAPEIG